MDDRRRCSYEVEKEEWAAWGGDEDEWEAVLERLGSEGDTWRCPHEVGHDPAHCCFHADDPKRDQSTALLAAIRDTEGSATKAAQRTQFLGATFRDLDLRDDSIGAHASDPLYLWGATFENGCTVEDVDFYTDVSFDYATFESGTVRFDESEFHASGDVSFEDVSVTADVERASFATVDFENGGDVRFRGAAFENGGDVRFDDTDFVNPGAVDFTRASFDNDGQVAFDGATFVEDVDFGSGFPDTESVSLAGASFAAATLDVESLVGADLAGADLSGVNLCGTDIADADIDHAVVTDAAVDGATRISSNDPPRFWYEYGLTACDPRVTDTESNPEKAARIYRRLEQLGRDNNVPRLQTEAYVYRKDMNTYRHRQRRGWTTLAGLHHRLKYRYAWTARVCTLYGDSPWRVVGTFCLLVATAAVGYYLGGANAGNPTMAESLYYSLLTAVGTVPFTPAGWVRLVVGVESVLGAGVLALLVFVLGRRTTR